MTETIEHFGRWPSPISTKTLTQNTVRLSEPQVSGKDYYWLESRPEESGRSVLVQQKPGQKPQDILPKSISIKTRAHEYGGASYLITGDTLFAIFDQDQRLYKIPLDNNQATMPKALTPKGNFHYADFSWDKTRNRLIAVREDHTHVSHAQEKQERNEIVSIDINQPNNIHVLVTGADFYSNPCVSPDGKNLSWLSWNHPQMPWDGTECFISAFDLDGKIQSIITVAGNNNESIFQPQWSPCGKLYFVSDKTNWWNLYAYNPTTHTTDTVLTLEAEFATPQWIFGMSTYGFFNAENILCCYTQDGHWKLFHLNIAKKEEPLLLSIDPTLVDVSSIRCNEHGALFLGASVTQAESVYSCPPSNEQPTLTRIACSQPDPTINDYLSAPKALSFITQDQQQAHGFYYAPTNPNYRAPQNELPPLIIMCHGGPTGSTSAAFNYRVQYWTTRGFAVFDINYRGSTGFGRKYRDSLKNNWGIKDVIDVASGALFLVKQKLADPKKLIIRGSSAGGYTVLAALTFTDTFSAGASLYGIGDLEALASDTHKFESHSLETLVGEYPKEVKLYQARSPIHHVEQLTCPVIFFQGLKDKIVPPNQAEAMVEALTLKGINNRYVTFENEGHGFRQANSIEAVYTQELAFYLNTLHL